MKAAALDLDRPETARTVGAELATTTGSLASRLALSTGIDDEVSLQQAVDDRRTIGDAVKRVKEFFAPFKRMADQMHKALCDRENEILAPLLTLDTSKARAIRDFNDAQVRERRRLEQERAAATRREQEATAAREGAILEAAGEHVQAAAVIDEAIARPAPVVAIPAPKIDGLKFARRWRWRYVGGPEDVSTTPPDVLARAMDSIPRPWLCADEKKIGAYVRSMKETASIPGVEVYSTDEPVR